MVSTTIWTKPSVTQSREDFEHELLQIVSDIDEQWATLASSHTNPYRRVMIDIGHSVPIFSVQGLLGLTG